MKKMNKKDLLIGLLVLVILVMWEMNITPQEFAHLVTNTLPNYIVYKMG